MPWSERSQLKLGVIGFLAVVVAGNALIFSVSFTYIAYLDKVYLVMWGMLTMGAVLLTALLRVRHAI